MFVHTCCYIFNLWWLGWIKISKEFESDLNLVLKICKKKENFPPPLLARRPSRPSPHSSPLSHSAGPERPPRAAQ